MSRRVKRLAIAVRSEPTVPPSGPNLWQARHCAFRKASRPFSKLRPLRGFSTSPANSSAVHFFTKGSEARFCGGGRKERAMTGSRALRSASVKVATASARELRRKPAKLWPPLCSRRPRSNHPR